ncbi:DUF72 domain-containing protein [Thermosipho atlanticus]|uniref:Uncharacterized conserved protein YecE, DUF72 family n=1 Tax=Thermosipho atlanticus DSM 15807 TaxID=1123380 RepID=A0A1M5R640_9BACT|nr:DUF72 domain-containing protein [Thermosipho atlanticus]SHH21792.1 Uncharacterized conserved protein YecE, DUF72 family [Thermosipho atlanticus DSM 15807]
MFYIGTSGWSYDHWQKIFYPEGLERSKWLNFYSVQFNTVEINSTFYRLPFESIVKSWYKKTPENFVFSLKGPRIITHKQRLKDVNEYFRKFIDRIKLLNEKLKVILWQLPPSLKEDKVLLSEFIDILPKNIKHTLELRHPSWFNDNIFSLLQKNNIAFCISDSSRYKSMWLKTANFVYIRFHGPKKLYASEYGEKLLKNFVTKILEFNCETYVYFNNDFNGFALKDAKLLKNIINSV